MEDLLSRAQNAINRARDLSVEVNQDLTGHSIACLGQGSAPSGISLRSESPNCTTASTENTASSNRQIPSRAAHLKNEHADNPAEEIPGRMKMSQVSEAQHASAAPQATCSQPSLHYEGRDGSNHDGQEAACLSGRTSADESQTVLSVVMSKLQAAVGPAEEALHRVALNQRRWYPLHFPGIKPLHASVMHWRRTIDWHY